jgi:DMSO/TMAO reductase YedYZ molybdopterin-dependent catalytic subunit
MQTICYEVFRLKRIISFVVVILIFISIASGCKIGVNSVVPVKTELPNEQEEHEMQNSDESANFVTPVKTELSSEQEEHEMQNSDESADSISAATEDRYEEREIREYKGMKLDPAIGPRDNSISGTQYVDIEDYQLRVTGIVNTPLTLKYSEVLEFPAYERLITLYCIEGWDATILWEGIKLTDILEEAGGIGSNAKVLIFKAVDGYTTSIPIEKVLERDMLIAYKANGIDLPPEMGYPFIVLAEDRLGYKWARWIVEIEVSDNENYEGYWESRGYSNVASIPEGRKTENE